MAFYEEQVLPRVIDLVLGTKSFGKLRRRALEGVAGTVVEVGFGSGTNLPYYPDDVTKVLAVDPSATGERLAKKRIAARGLPVDFIGLDGQRLPLDDASVDHAVSTWTLCTIPDAAAALAELHRVLRPGGTLHFIEHGLSDDPKVARRQHRLDGLQQRIAGGCHLDRDHRELLAASPFTVDTIATFAVAGPKTMSFLYAGTAHRA